MDLVQQQIEILRVDLNRQGSLMQRDMQALVTGMTTVIQALDKRIAVLEAALKSHNILADRTPGSPFTDGGKEL